MCAVGRFFQSRRALRATCMHWRHRHLRCTIHRRTCRHRLCCLADIGPTIAGGYQKRPSTDMLKKNTTVCILVPLIV